MLKKKKKYMCRTVMFKWIRMIEGRYTYDKLISMSQMIIITVMTGLQGNDEYCHCNLMQK